MLISITKQAMAMINTFEHLPDLVLFDIFSYLSTTDVLFAFTHLKSRFTQLLTERGFYRHVDLSSLSCRQFHELLPKLPLDDVESLLIDRHASPLQLLRWFYLPSLKRLHLRGVREYESVFVFVLLHATTLTHIAIESGRYFLTEGLSETIHHSTHHLYPMVKNLFLQHLPQLRSLDLGFDSGQFVLDWDITSVQAPLTHLRVTLHRPMDLLYIMATKPLCDTLRQLHVKLQDRRYMNGYLPPIFDGSHRPMSSLHTFTFMKSLYCESDDEWTYIDMITSSKVMPVLRRIHFICGITEVNLNRVAQSPLFNDHRQVDVHFALLLNHNQCHTELTQIIPHGSRSHPRSIASATFYRNKVHPDLRHNLPYSFGIYDNEGQSHLWYTLPWAFNDFLQLSVPDPCIARLQMSEPSPSLTMCHHSRIRKMRSIRNVVTPFIIQSSLVRPDRIDTLDLFYCDRSISLQSSSLVHLNLVDSFDAILSCHLISTNLRSITIVMHQADVESASNRWTDLGLLKDLPRLHSVRVLLYSTLICPNDVGCQMLAETSLIVSDFGISFREDRYSNVIDRKSLCDIYRSFIKKLHQKMISLSPDKYSSYLIERNGCGLIVWR